MCNLKNVLHLPSNCECSSGVEHHLAKVRVVGSNPITRSISSFLKRIFIELSLSPGGGIGRHVGLKIQWTVMSVRVQVPPWVLLRETVFNCLPFLFLFLLGELFKNTSPHFFCSSCLSLAIITNGRFWAII